MLTLIETLPRIGNDAWGLYLCSACNQTKRIRRNNVNHGQKTCCKKGKQPDDLIDKVFGEFYVVRELAVRDIHRWWEVKCLEGHKQELSTSAVKKLGKCGKCKNHDANFNLPERPLGKAEPVQLPVPNLDDRMRTFFVRRRGRVVETVMDGRVVDRRVEKEARR